MINNPGNYTEEEVLQKALQAYQTGQASFPLDLQNAALIIIDMQSEFVKPHLTPFWVPEATRMIPRLAAVLEKARKAGIPVIHTAFAKTHLFHDRPRSGATMPNRYPELPSDGLFEKAEIVPELAPNPNEVLILKPSYGAFYDTPLDTILRNFGCDTVIITGTLTNVCCGTTARQAYERGYKVVFGADLTATNNTEQHEAELKTLRYGFARVVTGAEIIESLDLLI